jgi:hypothetical protein
MSQDFCVEVAEQRSVTIARRVETVTVRDVNQ